MAEFHISLKFVVSAPEDLDEIARIDRVNRRRSRSGYAYGGRHDATSLRERGLWIAEIAKRDWFSLQPAAACRFMGQSARSLERRFSLGLRRAELKLRAD